MNISRRQFLAAASATALAFSLPLSAQTVADQRKRNVLFIAVDDLRPHLGCYGNTLVKSPHIDKLAAGATVFLYSYCQQAVCAPSRASLLSGCRPDTTKVWDLHTPLRTTMPDVVTLPEMFRQSGYTTIGLGKIYRHLKTDDPKAWSVPPVDYPGMTWVAPESKAIMAELESKATPQSKSKGVRGPAYEHPDVPDDAYADGKLAAAIDQLRELGKSDKPFFLAVGFHRPHLPFNAPKRYWDMYDPATIPLADNPEPPKNGPAIALHNSGELRQYAGIPKQGIPATKPVARELVHGYFASIAYVDAQIGKVLDALDASGMADNTIVVLWGDHGWHLGDHGLWCKHTNFETATHAPLIIRAPGYKPGKTQRLSEFVDVFPTLCDLTNLKPPATLEGVSLVPLMRNPDLQPDHWKKAAFSQYPRGRDVMGYSVTDGRYRFTRWQKKDGSVVATELYDHQTDPEENLNLADDPAHSEARRTLADLLDRGWKAAQPQ